MNYKVSRLSILPATILCNYRLLPTNTEEGVKA